jgi:solute carrier family 25 carnitine/acylcarnitine transporter 20/29
MSTDNAPKTPITKLLPTTPPTAADKMKDDVAEAAQGNDADTTVNVTGSFAQQARSFAAGGFGGLCAVVVGHPFDLVKVRLQTAETGRYKSAIDVVRKSVARDGLRRGLYAGVSAPLVGVTPMCESFFVFLFFSPFLLLPFPSPFLVVRSATPMASLHPRIAPRPADLSCNEI